MLDNLVRGLLVCEEVELGPFENMFGQMDIQVPVKRARSQITYSADSNMISPNPSEDEYSRISLRGVHI